jgi:hypothetical protein
MNHTHEHTGWHIILLLLYASSLKRANIALLSSSPRLLTCSRDLAFVLAIVKAKDPLALLPLALDCERKDSPRALLSNH